MKRVLIASLLIASFLSCRKDRLDAEYGLIEGKWKWVESYAYSYSWPPDSLIWRYPGDNYEVFFKPNAKIVYYHDGNRQGSVIIEKMQSDYTWNGYIPYTLTTKKGRMGVTHFLENNTPGPHDTLSIDNFFPFDSEQNSNGVIVNYCNIFVKE